MKGELLFLSNDGVENCTKLRTYPSSLSVFACKYHSPSSIRKHYIEFCGSEREKFKEER